MKKKQKQNTFDPSKIKECGEFTRNLLKYIEKKSPYQVKHIHYCPPTGYPDSYTYLKVTFDGSTTGLNIETFSCEEHENC
jgi:hypothetical protein